MVSVNIHENRSDFMTNKELDELKEYLKGVICDIFNKGGFVPPMPKASSFEDKVKLQIERNDTQHKMFETDEKDKEAFTNYQKILGSLPTVIENKQAQNILDCFNFKSAVNVGKRMGYKYQDRYATVEDLVGDAITLFESFEEKYKDAKSGRLQIGRLWLNKYFNEADGEWYSLVYEAESWED